METLLVLHLEDNSDDAFFFKRFIDKHLDKQQCVAQILHVATRDAYVAALERQRPDLIISDNSLPGCNSLEALELARTKYPAIPFLVLSGLIMDDMARRLVDGGAAGIIPKNELALMLPVLLGLKAGGTAGLSIGTALRHALAESEALAAQRLRRIEELVKVLALRNAQLAAATGELETWSYAVAHDLRAPLHNINVYALLLLEEYPDALDTQAMEFLTRISSEADRMTGMIDNLHRLASYSSADLKIAEVDLGAIASAHLARLQQTEPQRNARFDIAGNLRVAGDPELLKVMLESLLGNAWKYTQRCPLAHIAVGVSAAEGVSEYFVRDNGAGFDMRYAGKLFVPFQQLHAAPEFRGAGLGLATVKRIIGRHGGSVRAEASVDRGATFFFTLPQ